MHIDWNLNFKKYIDHISIEIFKSVGISYRLDSYLPSDILKLLYNSLILPYLTYSIESWYKAPQYMSSKVNVIQKKYIINIYSLPYKPHTNLYFKSNNISKLFDIYNPSLCSHVFKYIKSQNNDLTCRPGSNSQMHNHSTRNRTNLLVPRFNRSASQWSFLYFSVTDWKKTNNSWY